jgi:hypothetical protein
MEPVFRTFDDADVPLQRIKVQRNADGTESAVWERWLAFRADPAYLSLYARWDPGMVVRRHGHNGPHVLVVLSGSVRIGDRECCPGTHVELPVGAAFGPHVAGPAGCELFEVMVGDPRSWGDDLAAYERVCAELGVTPLPDPPIDLPEWLSDERSRWGQK